jgi:alkaline phosphatase D
MLLAAGLAMPHPAGAQAAAPRRILFGSCLDVGRPHPMLDAAADRRPDLFIFMGDNIYADTLSPAVLREKYAALAASADFRRLAATCPLLATWDDHDYGLNDAGKGFPMKRESRRQFLDFWQVPADSPRRQHEGIYDAQVYGAPGRRLQVILLDTRWFRTALRPGRPPSWAHGPYLPDGRPGASLLGEEQWRWLEERLREPAQLRLVVSSIQVLSEHHGWEAWANFPREQERLFELLRRTRAEGVIFLSGDRHFAEISRREEAALYPLYDITSSALNWRFPEAVPNPNRFRLGGAGQGAYLLENYGELEVDWEDPAPVLRLRIADAAGETRLSAVVPLSELEFPALSGERSRPGALSPPGTGSGRGREAARPRSGSRPGLPAAGPPCPSSP